MRHFIVLVIVILDLCINLKFTWKFGIRFYLCGFTNLKFGKKSSLGSWGDPDLAVVLLTSAGRRSAGSAQVEIVTGQKPTNPDSSKFYAM